MYKQHVDGSLVRLRPALNSVLEHIKTQKQIALSLCINNMLMVV